MKTHRSLAPLAALALAAGLAACGQRAEERTPTAVDAPNVSGGEGSTSPALSGGVSGQTPAYGEPGGAPSVVQSQGGQAGPSIGSENSPTQ